MKGKKLTLIMVMLLVLVCTFALTACHTHESETAYTFDNVGHWHKATCKHTDEKIGYEVHTVFEVPAVEATCTTEGNNRYFKCVCGAFFKDEAKTLPTYDYAEKTPVKAHVYDQKVATPSTLVTAATCTSKAVYHYTCVCGAVGTDTFESGEVTAHNLQLINAVEATCKQAGNNAYYQCADCEAYFRDEAATTPTNPDAEVLPITAHTPVYHAGIAATCTQEGKTEYWTCSVCDKIFEDAYCTYETTGPRTIPTIAHTYGNVADAKYKVSDATCKALAVYNKSCTVCGEKGKDTFTFGDYAAHVLTEIAAVAPTCSLPGSQKYYSCSVCEKFYTDLTATKETTPEEMVVGSTGHKYDQQVVKTEYLKEAATCQKLGVYYTSCVCGKMDKNESKTFEGGAKGQHIAGSVVPRVEATCTVDGNIEYWICAVCSQNCHVNAEGRVVVLDAGKYEDEGGLMIRAAHDWAQVVDAKAIRTKATCGELATYFESCRVCGEVHDEEYNKNYFETGTRLPHTVNEWVPYLAATCTTEGNIEYGVCQECSLNIARETGEVVESFVIPTPNDGKHDYTSKASDEYIYSIATCESPALYYKSCRNCGCIDEESEGDARFFEYGDALPHVYGAFVDALAPTCTDDGNIEYCICTECENYFDKDYKMVETPVLTRTGHTVVEDPTAEGVLVTPATCTARAVYKTSCSVCGHVFDQTFTAGEYKEHTWGTLHDAVEATCDTEGMIAYYQCAECYQYFNADKNVVTILATNPLGHKMVEVILENDANLVSAATCTNRAKYDTVCERCNKTAEVITGTPAYFERGEKLEHNYGAIVTGTPATCDANGTIDHYKCSSCNQYFNAEKNFVGTTEADLKISPLGHKYINVVAPEYLDAEATCLSKASYVKVCERCNKTSKEVNPTGYETFEDGDLADHVYGTLIAAVPATCTTDGNVAHYKCSVCSKVFNEEKTNISSEVLVKLGHDFTRETNNVKSAANCTDNAIHYYGCSRCDVISDSATYEVANSKLGHNTAANITVGYAETCTTDGQIDHFYCDRCNEYLDKDKNVVDTIVIPAPGHDYTKKILTAEWQKSPATCADAAVYYYACSRCDIAPKDDAKTYTEGEALPHVYGTLVHGYAALCDQDGLKAHTICENCGKYFDVDNKYLGDTADCTIIPKLGHNYTAKTVANKYFVTEATCSANAVYYISCANEECGEIDPEQKTFEAEGTKLNYCLAKHLNRVAAVDEFMIPVNQFPAKCNYEHWKCTLCEKIYSDAMGQHLYEGDPYYMLQRRTMAIGKMDGDKFVVDVETTLAHAGGYSYTIGGIVPYIVRNDWKQANLTDGNRVAIQFAAKYFEYASKQAGVIAKLTSDNYVREFTAADLQAGNTTNNIEAGSLVAIFNIAVDTDIKLEILTETGFVTYTFKLATSIELIKHVAAVEETYWNDGNHEYFVCGGAFFKDGFANEPIADINAYLIPQKDVQVQLGNVVDNAFVVAGNNYSATLTETSNDVYLLEGAILTGKDGKSYFTIRLNADLGSYFTYVADNEEVLRIVLADGTEISYKLPDFKFEADGTYVITFEVKAGKTCNVSLRSPKSMFIWLDFDFVIDADFVCPTLVEGVAATYWADGISDHYTLTDELGVVTHYSDIYCTQVVELNALVAPQLELNITAGNNAYTFTRDSFAKYTLSGVVAHVADDAYTAFIKVANSLLNAYEGCEETLVVAKLNGADVTLAQLRALVADGIAMEASKAQTLTFAIINPKNAADVVTYEFVIGEVNCPKFIETVLPTYFAVGINEHYRCAVTGKYFADANCAQEITVADLTVEKLIPTAQAGSYDTANNAFVLGGVYYSIAYNKTEAAYILSGAVVAGQNLPVDQYAFGYVIRFNDNFANFYTALNDDAVVVKVTFAGGREVTFTKANAFEADGTIVFRGDAASDVIEFALWNTVTNDWETYVIKNHSDFNRLGVLVDAQVGSFGEDGAFMVGRRNYLYIDENKEVKSQLQDLRYTVAINDRAEYVISGIVPSVQDKYAMDIGKYEFSLRFNYDFSKLFTNVANDVEVLRYVAPDGTVYATYTKAEVFANEISICFTGDALVDGVYKCQILNADGSVMMEYRIKVAQDIVCPVYMYETAPNYWGQGFAQHYRNARVEGKYYSDYECTTEIAAENLFTEKLVFDGMTVGSYVANADGGYRFGTYDYIDYSVVANEQGVYVFNGRIPCSNDARDEGLAKQLHKFVVKLNGVFAQTYKFYQESSTNKVFTEETVIAKVTVVTLEGTTVLEIKKKDLVFDADGSIVFIHEAIKGAEIALDLMNPISGAFGELVYNFYVSPDVVYTHDSKYEVGTPATYWAEGQKVAHCQDCDLIYNVVGDEGVIAKALPTVQVAGNDVNNVAGVYTASVTGATVLVIKLDMAQFEGVADDVVVLTIGSQTFTKAQLVALNGIVEITVDATTNFAVAITNGTDTVNYEIVIEVA